MTWKPMRLLWSFGSEVEGTKASVTEAVKPGPLLDQAMARRGSPTLDAAAGDLAGRITNEETARVNADSAVLTAARSLVVTAESGLTAKVNDEAAARLSGDQAEAYRRPSWTPSSRTRGTICRRLLPPRLLLAVTPSQLKQQHVTSKFPR